MREKQRPARAVLEHRRWPGTQGGGAERADDTVKDTMFLSRVGWGEGGLELTGCTEFISLRLLRSSAIEKKIGSYTQRETKRKGELLLLSFVFFLVLEREKEGIFFALFIQKKRGKCIPPRGCFFELGAKINLHGKRGGWRERELKDNAARVRDRLAYRGCPGGQERRETKFELKKIKRERKRERGCGEEGRWGGGWKEVEWDHCIRVASAAYPSFRAVKHMRGGWAGKNKKIEGGGGERVQRLFDGREKYKRMEKKEAEQGMCLGHTSPVLASKCANKQER